MKTRRIVRREVPRTDEYRYSSYQAEQSANEKPEKSTFHKVVRHPVSIGLLSTAGIIATLYLSSYIFKAATHAMRSFRGLRHSMK